MIDKETILEDYVPFAEPIPFKDWEVHPITVKKSKWWKEACRILMIEKNYINDMEVLQMSYLKFLILLGLEEPDILPTLEKIIRTCLNIDDDLIVGMIETEDEKDFSLVIGPAIITKTGSKIINTNKAKTITSKEFEEFKTIVLIQNILEYDDSYIDPDVKKAIEEYYSLLNKDAEEVSFEKQIACVQSSTSFTLQQIKEMTYRSFMLLFETIVDKVEYPVIKGAELNGTTFKNGKTFDHWVYKKKHDKFGDAFVQAKAFEGKLGVSGISQAVENHARNPQTTT